MKRRAASTAPLMPCAFKLFSQTPSRAASQRVYTFRLRLVLSRRRTPASEATAACSRDCSSFSEPAVRKSKLMRLACPLRHHRRDLGQFSLGRKRPAVDGAVVLWRFGAISRCSGPIKVSSLERANPSPDLGSRPLGAPGRLPGDRRRRGVRCDTFPPYHDCLAELLLLLFLAARSPDACHWGLNECFTAGAAAAMVLK